MSVLNVFKYINQDIARHFQGFFGQERCQVTFLGGYVCRAD